MTEKFNKINLIDKSISPKKIVLTLAMPTIIQQLLQTLVQYADTAMVGRMGAGAGVIASAAIGVNTSTIWLFNGIINALGVGFSVLVARRLGEGDAQKAKKVTRQSLIAVFIFGILMTAAAQILAPLLPRIMGVSDEVYPYARDYMMIVGFANFFNTAVLLGSAVLRCAGDTKSPMFFNILTNVINVIGNFFLIFPSRTLSVFGKEVFVPGADMGVRGAAWATAGSTAISGILILAVFFAKKNLPVRLTVRGSYRLDKSVFRSAIRLGTPNAMERVTLSLGHVALTALISSAGTVALAAHQFAITAESISYLPVFGFSVAATTLVAQSMGAKENDMAYNFARLCIRYGLILLTLAGAMLFFFSENLVSIFTNDSEVIRLGGIILKIEAFAVPFFSLANVVSGVLRGAGDTKWPFYISLIGMWGVRISLAVVLIKVFDLGVIGGWIGMATDLVVRGTLCYTRFRRKKWLNTDWF